MAYFFAALLAGFFAFNAFATPRKAARAVESSLRKLFPGALVRADFQGKRGRAVLKGQFRSARVEMSRFDFGSGPGILWQVVPSAKSTGRVGHLEIVLRDFRWQAFRVASAEMSVDNLRVDWAALRKDSQLKLVSLSDPAEPRTAGRVRVVLGQDALLAWVRERYPDIENATVSLASDRSIRVRGRRALLGASLPLELAGVVNLREGRVLEVSSPTVSAGGAALPALLAGRFTSGLSSIFEIDPKGAWPLSVSGAALSVQSVAGVPALVLDAQVALKPAQVLAPAAEPQNLLQTTP